MSSGQNMYHCHLQEYQGVIQLQCQNFCVSAQTQSHCCLLTFQVWTCDPDFKVIPENVVTSPETCSHSYTSEKGDLNQFVKVFIRPFTSDNFLLGKEVSSLCSKGNWSTGEVMCWYHTRSLLPSSFSESQGVVLLPSRSILLSFPSQLVSLMSSVYGHFMTWSSYWLQWELSQYQMLFNTNIWNAPQN